MSEPIENYRLYIIWRTAGEDMMGPYTEAEAKKQYDMLSGEIGRRIVRMEIVKGAQL